MWQHTFDERLTRDRSLRELTTIRVGGVARCVVAPADDDEVGRLLRALHADGAAYRILGGGSNTLAADGVVHEVVVLAGGLTELSREGTRLVVGAGMALSKLIVRANGLGLAGLHVLAGIPGQVGGAVVMNAGGRYGEIGGLVEEVRVRLPDGSAARLGRDQVTFAYRSSSLPPGAVVTSVVLALDPADDPRALRRESGRIIKEKNAAQPTTSWNFGCMFKNPPGGSAGLLIEQAGLKGVARGGARISPLHGNFVENLGEASAADVRALLDLAQETVRRELGVVLEREVRVWEPGRAHGRRAS